MSKCEHQYVREDDEIFYFPIKINKNLLDSDFIDFVYDDEVTLPFYFSYGFIHFMDFSDYKKIINQSLAENINPIIYKKFIDFFRNKISAISDVEFTGI